MWVYIHMPDHIFKEFTNGGSGGQTFDVAGSQEMCCIILLGQ